MKAGTTFKITLIADARFLGNCANVETLLSVKRTCLKAALSGEGVGVWEVGEERLLDNWKGEEKEIQLRQDFTLMLSKNLSKNDIYKIINQVESQPLKFN